jgi:hypothetical protein
MNFRLEKDVIPLSLDLKAEVGTSNRVFMAYIFAGPSLNVVRTVMGGYFGNANELYARAGVHCGGGMHVAPVTALRIRFDVSYDYFDLPGTHALLADGGPGGGATIALGLEYRL